MNTPKNKKYFLILANFKHFYLALLFLGVFLFPKTAYLSTISPEKIIELTNIKRAEQGLGSLNANQYLSSAAYNKANDIFREQKFEHNFGEKRFSSWVRDVGYEYKYVGENLAIDFISSEGVVNAWINSPTHYKNLINEKFSEIGVAVVNGKFSNEDSTLVVQIFGTPYNENIALTSIENNIITKDKFSSIENIYSLDHTSHRPLDEFNLTYTEGFLNIDSKTTINDSERTNNSLENFLFALMGFLYVGFFKILSIKNAGI